MSIRDQLNSYIQQLERRLRLGAMLRGAAILTSVALAATVVLVLITNALAFSRWSITSARVALLFALVLAVTFGIALPLIALNRRRAARQAEEMFPEFKQRLVTFAERDAEKREPFLDLLAADTLNVARDAEPKSPGSRQEAGDVSRRRRGVAVRAGLADPGRAGIPGRRSCVAVGGDAARRAAPFYDIQVVPGDISVRRNSDLMVTAQLIGLQTQNVRLYARYQSASKWEQVAMQPQAGGSGFQFVFAGLPESVEYYVEAGPLRLEALQHPRARSART